MTAYERHVRFATTLTIRGAVVAMLGLATVLVSDRTLAYVTMLASVIMMASGSYGVALGARARRISRGWPIPVIDGAASLGMGGGVAIALTAGPERVTLVLAALGLIGYGALTGMLALALWPVSRTRAPLLAWSASSVLLAGLILSFSAGMPTLRVAGAAYAIAYGAVHVAAGRWVRCVAASEVTPTRQSGWRATAAI